MLTNLPADVCLHVFGWLTDVDMAAYQVALYGDGFESIQRQYIRDNLCIVCRNPCRTVDGIHRLCKNKKTHIHRAINEEVQFFKSLHTNQSVCKHLSGMPTIFANSLARMIRKSDPCIPNYIYKLITDGEAILAINRILPLVANISDYMKACYVRWTASAFMSIHCMTKKEIHILFFESYPDQTLFIKIVGERVDRSVRAYNTMRVPTWIQESCRTFLETECAACSGWCARTACVGCIYCQNHNETVCENRLAVYDRLRSIVMDSVDDTTILRCPEPMSLTMAECIVMRSNIVQVVVACVVWFERMRTTERENVFALKSLVKYLTYATCLTERCTDKINLTLYLLLRIGNVTEMLTPQQLMLMNEIQIFDLLDYKE